MNKLPTGIINIEGEKDLVRDRNSKALLNTNLESLKAYKICLLYTSDAADE